MSESWLFRAVSKEVAIAESPCSAWLMGSFLVRRIGCPESLEAPAKGAAKRVKIITRVMVDARMLAGNLRPPTLQFSKLGHTARLNNLMYEKCI